MDIDIEDDPLVEEEEPSRLGVRLALWGAREWKQYDYSHSAADITLAKNAYDLEFFSQKVVFVSTEPTEWLPSAGPQRAIPFRRFPDVEAEIERAAAAILLLPNDWDGEGAKRFEQATFDRATELMRDLVAQTVAEFAAPLVVPTLGPTPDGSIDVYWKSDSVTLLCNVPPDRSIPITFSGRRGKETLAGKLDTDQLRLGHLAAWLASTR